MRTDFTPDQRAQPEVALCEPELRRCVHCGFCTAVCPTYVLDGNELDSPRGRITLIQAMLEEGESPDPETVTHIDRCLSCLACSTTCPSGVDYRRLIDTARQHIEAHYVRPWPDRLMRRALGAVLPNSLLFRLALGLGRLARPVAGLMPVRLRPLLENIPARGQGAAPRAALYESAVPRRLRVVLLAGCVQDALDATINEATIRVLTKLGADVLLPRGTACCGALSHHLGREAAAVSSARRNVAIWDPLLQSGEADLIVSNAAGCGTMMKDYGFLLQGEAGAARVAAAARDVSEVVEMLMDDDFIVRRGYTLAYQSACSLQHGQKIDALPKRLLSRAGYTVVDLPEAHLCCGSAGTYNLLEPDFATRLAARKAAAIDGAAAQGAASGNIGCLTQLRPRVKTPIAHTVEWLDWALGGPEPAALRNAQSASRS